MDLASDTPIDSPDTPDSAVQYVQIGPAGGAVALDGVRLVVPPGALTGPTELAVVLRDGGEDAVPDGARLSATYELLPSGIAFQVPATIEFQLPGPVQARVFWTHGESPTELMALPTRLTGTTATAPIVHFSSVYLAVPTTNVAGWYCCSPNDPLAHTDADCISWTAGTGTTCDPAICSLAPGACPTDPPTAGCCAPGPTGDEPTSGCGSLLTYGQCALGIGAPYCTWSGACSTATPGCCSATDPANDNPTAPCAVLDPAACAAAPLCQIGSGPGCAAPTSPPCGACQDPTFTADPAFATGVQTTLSTLGAASCATLAATPVTAPSTPGAAGYSAALGAWCAFEALLGANGCGASTQAPACTGLPTSCCTAAPTDPPGVTCSTLSTLGACEQLAGAGYCDWNPLCGAPNKGCCAPIDLAHDHPGLPCAQMPDYAECVTSLGYGYCEWSTTCAAPSLCDECTSPTMLNDPAFQSAQQSWLATHTSPTCASLASAPTPAPTAAAGSPQWKSELGPWCAYQQSLVGKACTSPAPECPNLPSSCCFATDPTVDLSQPGGCSALVSQFDCEYNVGLHYCTWNPSCGLATPTQCCKKIDPAIDEPVVGCDAMPDYGECVNSLGFGYCRWDPSAGCPLPAALLCPYCADPAYIGDPDVQTAYIASHSSYVAGGCAFLAQAPVPPPTGPATTQAGAATVFETELGRFCGWEAAFAALSCGATTSVKPTCPAPPPPSTCCSPAIPGIDPPTGPCSALTTYGDCTQGAGQGSCVWHPSASCAVPPNPACQDCVSASYASDPDVASAKTTSYQAYLQGGCGFMTSSPVPPPAGPATSSSSGATVYETQLGRFCGFELAFLAAQCLPSSTVAPACPGLVPPATCCSSAAPGLNPPTGSCAAIGTYSDCTAQVGTCVWNTSAACPLPTTDACAACADPINTGNPSYQNAFSVSYQAYLTTGCGTMAASPVPAPTAAVGSNLYAVQLGRHCGYLQAIQTGGCGASVPAKTCPVDLCTLVPTLCPNPLPTCSACASLSSSAGFTPAFNQQLSIVASGGCAPAQTQGPPPITAAFGSSGYAAQAGAYCGFQTAMQQNCNSPGCGAGGCAACLDLTWTSNPTFAAALHFGWTRFGAETCGDLSALAIPAPTLPTSSPAYATQLGRWCAFQLALEKNACGSSTCPGLSTCSANQVSCVLPTPTCADCIAPAAMLNPSWQAGFLQSTSALGSLSCIQAYSTPPPTVWSGPAGPTYWHELGVWCGYHDQLEQKCGNTYSQCAVP